jgi:mannosylglycerate hydrolase
LLTVHVVAHTHWDREWYQPFVRFRQRLVRLIDELLDDPPPADESFLLDGQAIVLEDYLDVRSERAAELSSLLQARRLEAGPWYVLPDELIPGGEALVRNLLLGRRVVRGLRAASPPVLYCPDSFGHPAALPMIAAGFGLPAIILWRGFGGARWPQSDVVVWRAADGERVVVYHLPPDGYEYGSSLPVDARGARERWTRFRKTYASRSATGLVLLPNGADHHARQCRQADAVCALSEAAAHTGDSARASSLGAFAEELIARARERDLPEIEGELRDSYGYTWTLQGTFATRADQKRRNARAERAIVRDAEPWAILAKLVGARSRAPLLIAAWRTLLQSHPHDTLCGCSIDAVAAAMDRRLADALVQANGIRDDAIADLIGYDADAARAAKSSWTPVVLVRNRAAHPRRGVAIVEIEQFIADVPVGPGSGAAAAAGCEQLPAIPSLGKTAIQLLDRRVALRRIEAPRHYPDSDLVAVTRAAVWIDEVPGYGLTALPLGGARSGRHLPPLPLHGSATSLDNGLVRVLVAEDGAVMLEEQESGRRLDDAFLIEDRRDVGDLYTPAIRDEATTAEFLGSELMLEGPLVCELRLRWRLRPRVARRTASTLTLRIRLVAQSPVARLEVIGMNRDRDHRLRIGIQTRLVNASVWADAAFGPVHRTRLLVPDEDQADEIPAPTAPLHRYVSLFTDDAGISLFSDGLAEYEASYDGRLFVTLLRAVGELSRNDLLERPGHAGWPSATPRAQSLGRFAARFGLLLHGPRHHESIDAIERAADDVLLPLEGRTLRSALGTPAPLRGAELYGRGLAFSSLKESEDGEWMVARCLNLLDEAVAGEWRFGVPIRDAAFARLDESPLRPTTVIGDSVPFEAPPHATITLLVR